MPRAQVTGGGGGGAQLITCQLIPAGAQLPGPHKFYCGTTVSSALSAVTSFYSHLASTSFYCRMYSMRGSIKRKMWRVSL